MNEGLIITSLTLILGSEPREPLRYAMDQLAAFCEQSAGTKVAVETRPSDAAGLPLTESRESVKGLPVYLGRAAVERFVPAAAQEIHWPDLGDEGFVLRVIDRPTGRAVIAAGATEAGTRQAVYALMRELDVSHLPPTLPASLNITEDPSFPLRGMYAHQHWGYNHPYALRTWTVDEWKRYVDILALMRVNLFQIWSMAGILPVPFSPEDEAFLKRYPPVIDHAHRKHGMTVWIGECANNMCDRRDVPPVAERDYFKVESLKNPADPAQMAQLRAARAEFYKVCNNADGYWVIDSDPGKWPGSPSSEFVDILMMNRQLINEHTLLGPKARLVYWMWFGWGTGKREANWRDTLVDLKKRSPEPWWMTVADKGHWQVVDELGVQDRCVYYPYGMIEPEPSLPFTLVVPQHLVDALNVPERIGKIQGAMGNAQTPVCQWPNIYWFTRTVWNMNLRAEPREKAIGELARLIYPERADLLAKAWLSLGSPEAPDAVKYADELESLAKSQGLGRPGAVGVKLFPDYGQVARDLAKELRIHAVAMEFCRRVNEADNDDKRVLDVLTRYCLLSLEWRRHTGFRNYGTNGYDFFPLKAAADKRWRRDNKLNPDIVAALERAMIPGYEDWEVKLVLDPLRQ